MKIVRSGKGKAGEGDRIKRKIVLNERMELRDLKQLEALEVEEKVEKGVMKKSKRTRDLRLGMELNDKKQV